jgi:predicted helicase
MNIERFLQDITAIYEQGNAGEHSYRPALHTLLSSIEPDVTALNEGKRLSYGAPDFQMYRGDILIGCVEAKDIGIGIRNMKDTNKEQQQRYLKGFPNFVYTNGLDWDFYRESERVASVSIADFLMGIQPKPEMFATLENWLKDFVAQRLQTITSPLTLAKMMAGKAVLIKDVFSNALRQDTELKSELAGQYKAFKEHLIHDITTDAFADIYAETIAYGMFAARLHDDTPQDFSRLEALELLPKSNPFLRKLFGFVAGPDLEEGLRWIIDDLAAIFQASDVRKLMEGFGSLTQRKDPFLHFYEDFLKEYDPARRKARGVWYTPEPVVHFIVRAVDEVLQQEFGLPDGLADTSKVTVDWDTGQTYKGKPVTEKKEVHRVQILDPATGTGTFLAEVIKQIAPRIRDVAPGMWDSYIEQHLIPRLHGFELLMASYAMCHMKLDMILTELGYKPTGNPPRLSVYLTNSLEEGEPANQSLPFAQWLSNEVKEANSIKRDMPIMCVIGNPPYSGISQNKGDWITNLIEDYKYVDGKHFGERKHWLQDDYVKFIRFAEYMIEKNGEGILGFITNHGYLDNPTFRGMRWHLLKTFDTIYVLDLHGNTKKKEVTPEGKPDKNVFDIQQGVAIIIAVKKTASARTKPLAQVYHRDLYGDRKHKYQALEQAAIKTKDWHKLEYQKPQYAFLNRDYTLSAIYKNGFCLSEIMHENITGIVTMGDGFALAENAKQLSKRFENFFSNQHTEQSLKRLYNLGKNYAAWIIQNREDLSATELKPVKFTYRPFDERVTYFDNRVLWRWRYETMKHMLNGKNIALICPKIKKEQFGGFVTNNICGHKAYDAYDSNSLFPLYLYPDTESKQIDALAETERKVNFDPKLFAKLQKLATDKTNGTPDELSVFDYIYGVLNAPLYRKTYAEFLKIDFPRIPWPQSPENFWHVSEKGNQLRRLHLMEPDAIGSTPYPFTGSGEAKVEKPVFEKGCVYINKDQCFENVPETAWKFYIGGYQPAQKWLKDRKGRVLDFEDVKHYQKIIKILSETDRIMQTIDLDLGLDGKNAVLP